MSWAVFENAAVVHVSSSHRRHERTRSYAPPPSADPTFDFPASLPPSGEGVCLQRPVQPRARGGHAMGLCGSRRRRSGWRAQALLREVRVVVFFCFFYCVGVVCGDIPKKIALN